MTLGRTQMVMSAPPCLRLPRLDSDLDRHLLARPERRQATARLRREWLESRREENTDDNYCASQLVKFRKLKANARNTKVPVGLKKDNNKPNQMPEVVINGTPRCWEDEITKRNIAERPSFFRHIRLATAPTREFLSDSPRAVMPMFHVARVTLHSDKGRNRMHFINKEWSSENVSWRRFNKNVSDFHKRSWIE